MEGKIEKKRKEERDQEKKEIKTQKDIKKRKVEKDNCKILRLYSIMSEVEYSDLKKGNKL